MTKAEIDDIFGEFEIDEDYMIKSKDVIGLFVAVKEEPKKEEEAPAPVEEAPADRMREMPRRRRRRRRRPPSKWLLQYLYEASVYPMLPRRSCLLWGKAKVFSEADFSATFVTFLKSSI